MTSLIKFFFVAISFVVERLSWRIILGGTSEKKMLLKKKLNIKKKKRKETERRSGSQTSRLRGEAVSIVPSMLPGGRPE